MSHKLSQLSFRTARSVIKGVFPFVLITLFILPIRYGEAFSSEDSEKQDTFKINNIIVNKVDKEIRLITKLALTEGILEYLLVSEPGKAYESVFKIIGNVPSELNFAMLLLGFKSMNFEKFMKLTNHEKGLSALLKDHKESMVELEILRNGRQIEWTRLMGNRGGSHAPLIWVYTGGVFIKDGKYAGDLELSHIGIWPDMSAVINLFSNMGNPYRGGFGLEINKENKTLKVDQDFEIVIRRHE